MFPEIMSAMWASLFFLCFTTQLIDNLTLKDSIKNNMLDKNINLTNVYLVSGSIILTASAYL